LLDEDLSLDPVDLLEGDFEEAFLDEDVLDGPLEPFLLDLEEDLDFLLALLYP